MTKEAYREQFVMYAAWFLLEEFPDWGALALLAQAAYLWDSWYKACVDITPWPPPKKAAALATGVEPV